METMKDAAIECGIQEACVMRDESAFEEAE